MQSAAVAHAIDTRFDLNLGNTTSTPATSVYTDGRTPPECLVGPVEVPFAVITLERYPELKIPRLLIKTRKGPIDEAGMRVAFQTLDEVLLRGHPITIAYDFRTATLPSRKQVSTMSVRREGRFVAADLSSKSSPDTVERSYSFR